MADYSSLIYDQIQEGAYKATVPFPERTWRLKDHKPGDPVYDNWLANKNAYDQSERDAIQRFKTDLEKEYGVSEHPKRHRLFELAWQEGHSAGLSEVLTHYTDMVDLLLP